MESRVDVTFPGTLVSSVPNPYYRATPAKPKGLVDFMYPVGFILTMYNHTDPNTIFTGTTWVRLENTLLWAVPANMTIGQITSVPTTLMADDYMPATNVSMWRRTA